MMLCVKVVMCVKCNILKEETYLKMVFANEKGTLPTYIFFFSL